jgi:hypothetical protein
VLTYGQGLVSSKGFQMKKLNKYNAFGSVLITPKYIGVSMFAFTSDGFMHQVANKFKIVPELPIKDRKGMEFAGNLVSGKEPDFVFSFVSQPDDVKSLIDEAQVIDSMYTVAFDLMKKIGFDIPEEEIAS